MSKKLNGRKTCEPMFLCLKKRPHQVLSFNLFRSSILGTENGRMQKKLPKDLHFSRYFRNFVTQFSTMGLQGSQPPTPRRVESMKN
jgi:hypothetical protein